MALGVVFLLNHSISPLSSQVNMVIGILVFNKLVSKDGITDMKLKERAGYAIYHSSILIMDL